MRLRHRSGRVVHLSHGVNLRPASDLDAVVAQLDTHAAVIRARLGVDTLGVSLWLPPTFAAALAVDARSRARLRAELDARGLEVVTLSGVPYAEGGDEGSATARYVPDWSSNDRLEYTLDLARILVDLLPEDAVRGAVTTVGLGRRAGWDQAKEKECARVLGRLSGGLAEVAWHTGRAVRVGFQPEPGCVMDDTASTIAALARVDKDRIGVCLDLANLACTWQEPAEALDRFAAAGVQIIRVQVAAAIEAGNPVQAAETLRGYVEADHLHQVTTADGSYVDDLSQALGEFPPGPWRVRYHLPLHVRPEAPLAATTEVWRSALTHLMGGDVPSTEYLDIESEAGPVDAEGITAELAFMKKELFGFGLSPPAQACPV
jgi:sugar phosphate isomerase/epimerase